MWIRTLFMILMLLGMDQLIWAQVRVKDPKVDMVLSGGYDSNILRVAAASDSNRIYGMVTHLDGKVIDWIYWNRAIRTYTTVYGDYFLYSGNSKANNWRIYGKVKNLADLYESRPGKILPSVRWDVEARVAIVDKYYSDRELGDELIRTIDQITGEILPLGDLFDRTSLRFGTGFQLDFGPSVELLFDVWREFNDYSDIGTPNTDQFYSLDNDKIVWETFLNYRPVSWLELQGHYETEYRTYVHKLANDLRGRDMQNIQREYTYKIYDFGVSGAYDLWECHLRYSNFTRTDEYQGYFNYDALRWLVGAVYNFSENWRVLMEYDFMTKSYERVTLGGNLLENDYYTLEARISHRLNSKFALGLIYLYEGENSTYQKFTYTRHLSYLTLSYDLSD